MLKTILIFITCSFIFAQQIKPSRIPPILKDIKIPGVDAASLAKLNEGLKSATTSEQRLAKIQEWEHSLHGDEKSIARDFFHRIQHHPAPEPGNMI